MKKILIIDDDPLIRKVYQDLFQSQDFRADGVGDAEAAAQWLSLNLPDLVLLDLFLPKVSGLEVLKQIRSELRTRHIPVIVFSNAYLKSMVKAAWKEGATECITKSDCTPEQLLALVRRTLNVPAADLKPVPAPPVAPAPARAPDATPPSSVTASPAAPRPAEANRGFPPTESARPTVQPSPGPKPVSAPFAGLRPAVAAQAAELPALAGAMSTASTVASDIFLTHLPQTLITCHNQLQALVGSGPEQRQKVLFELHQMLHSLGAGAGVNGFRRMALMASAVEALLMELFDEPRNINLSSLRTLTQSVDFLAALVDQAALARTERTKEGLVLVVDDEAVARQAVCAALEMANLNSISVGDSLAACKVLEETPFDLIILDIDMPGLNGFQLCERVRTLPSNKSTPVLFVTGLTGQETRAQSTVSGADDFITKPFLPIELTVKALHYALRGKMAHPVRLAGGRPAGTPPTW